MGLKYQPMTMEEAPAEETVNLEKTRQELTVQYQNSKEVDDIVSTICVNEPQTLVNFGNEVAEEISRCSDSILNSINMSQVKDSGQLLQTLGKIMDQFDLEEISTNTNKGVFKKLFGNLQKQIDQILSKYHTMGEEVDKIYVMMKQYEAEIIGSNEKLATLYDTNVDYYKRLLKYILAGEQGVSEIDAYINKMQKEYQEKPNQMLELEINNLLTAKEMLSQRVQDLRIAENVAMQSIPMIKSMQFGNLNLIRKINSAFIITLPVFKQALTQAILLKRQRVQAEAMEALDQRTNEMLIKNAQNTAKQTKMTAQLASGSAVKIETLETTWKTIVDGIEETRKIQQDAEKKRESDKLRLNQLKEEYKRKMSAS